MMLAKKDMIARSRAIVLATRGWRTFIATKAVGTQGGGSCRMTGARDPAADLIRRLGPRYDGGRRSCLRMALYTLGTI